MTCRYSPLGQQSTTASAQLQWATRRLRSGCDGAVTVGPTPRSSSPPSDLRPSSHVRGAREKKKGGIAIAMPPIPSVREGGVEPPRPFGHWNLNPARLPIPPPAHWVCLPASALSGWPLPTCRTLARRTGWVHIPFPGALTSPSTAGPRTDRPGSPRRAGCRRPGARLTRTPSARRPPSGRPHAPPRIAPHTPAPAPAPVAVLTPRPHRDRPHTRDHAHSARPFHHVSRSPGSRINLVPVPAISPGEGRGRGPVRDTGPGPALRSMPGRSSERSGWGNRLFARGVDTISKQYRRYRATHRTEQHRHHTEQDKEPTRDGGGAPWES